MLRALVFCLWLPLVAFAQAPSKSTPDAAATASVTGTVIKADTGEPLKKAQVTLWSNDRETSYGDVTDAEGRFQIPGVKPGRYQLWASRDGYVSVAYGEKTGRRRAPPVILEKGQQLRDVIFRLQRTAVIIGRVLDEDGEPVFDAEVGLSTRAPSFGRGSMQEQSVQTNDLGEYRIFRVSPGKYYLSARLPNRYLFGDATTTSDEAEEQKNEKRKQTPPTTYAPVFYPGTIDPDQARRVEIKAADEVRVDFTFTPVQAYRIRGRVLGMPLKTSEPIMVVLASRGGSGMEQQAGVFAAMEVMKFIRWCPVLTGWRSARAVTFTTPSCRTRSNATSTLLTATLKMSI